MVDLDKIRYLNACKAPCRITYRSELGRAVETTGTIRDLYRLNDRLCIVLENGLTIPFDRLLFAESTS